MTTSPKISLSVLTKPSGILTKKISYIAGKVQSDSSECKMSSGLSERVTINFSELPLLLKLLSPSQCIATGWVDTQSDKVEIITREKFESKNYQFPAQQMPHGVYATRTLSSFCQRGQSLIMFDYDDDASCPFKIDNPEQFIALLAQAIPNFDKTSYIRTYSSSSAIFDANTHQCLKPAAGFHIYMVVPDGQDVNRFGEVLEKRLWLAGLGYIKVSQKSASLLKRTIVDTAVFSPERLVFEAGAVISDPTIYQNLPAPEYIEKECPVLDTKQLLDLSDIEEKTYQTTVLEAKISDNVLEIKKGIKEVLAEEAIHKARTVGHIISRGQAMRMIDNLEKNILPPFHIIYFEDGSQASVMDIFINPALYDGKGCLDPLREDKGFGRTKVFANLDQAIPKPQIFSFVEGNRTFDLNSSMRLLNVKTVEEEFSALRDLVNSYESQNSEYFKATQLKPGINLIKGEKGTGKTFTVADTIRETDLSVLGITPRIGLTQTMAKDFSLACYNEDAMMESHVLRSQKRLGICYDSLHKIAGQYYDVIVVDEIIQVMRHVKSTSVKNKFVCLNVLRALILNARYVVLMDADISADYLGLLQDPQLGCCKQNIDIHLVINHYKPAAEQKRVIYNYTDDDNKPDETAWTLDLLEHVKHHGTFVATNSREGAYNIANEVLESWGMETVLEKGHFMTEYEGRRVITITSDNSGLTEVSDFVTNINTTLRESDVFIASPSLGTGISINKRDNLSVFKRVYSRFTKRAGNTSADCSQHIARIRGCTEFHCLILDTKEWYETDPNTIIDLEVYGRVKAVDHFVKQKDLNFDPYQNRYVFADNNWGQWFGRMTSFENMDRNEFTANFIDRLQQEGYTVHPKMVSLSSCVRNEKAEASKLIKENQKLLELKLVLECPLVSETEREDLEKKAQHTVAEKRLLLKIRTADTFGEYNQDGLAELLSLSKKGLNSRRMGLYFGMNPETLLITDLANRLDSEKMHIEKSIHFPRWILMTNIASSLGVSFDEDGLPVSNMAPINDGVKYQIYTTLLDRSADVKTVLGMNVKYHSDMLSIATVVGNVISSIGFKTIRKNFDGPHGRVKIPMLCPDHLNVLRQDIDRARKNSPSLLYHKLEDIPAPLTNYVAQSNAGMPEKAAKEHRYISQLNDYEARLVEGFRLRFQ